MSSPEQLGQTGSQAGASQFQASADSSRVQTIVQKEKELWLQHITRMYPKLLCGTSFLPPVYMNRTQHRPTEVDEIDVLETQAPCTEAGVKGVTPQTVVKDDHTNHKVLACLQKVSQDEVMFVLSGIKYENYLRKPFNAAAVSNMPRPADLRIQGGNKVEGDFDVLIIHRYHGFVAGEIKSVGGHSDESVKKTINKALRQMDRANEILEHTVPRENEQQPQPKMKTTLMVPNVNSSQLRSVLEANPHIKQKLCQCLSLETNNDPVPLCLTSDKLEDPVPLCLTSDKLEDPRKWWKKLKGTLDPVMTEELYLELVSRFAGPATIVTVHCSTVPRLALRQHSVIRSPGQGVAELANRFTPVDLVLHPDQVSILNDKKLRRVWLNGPPGGGKTLVLYLKAREWLSQHKRVHVVPFYVVPDLGQPTSTIQQQYSQEESTF